MNAMIDVRAPSESTEGTRSQVQRWLKSVGDSVQHNEPLLEIETDKVTIEVPAPAHGILCEILKDSEQDIEPGDLLGRIRVHAADEIEPVVEPNADPRAPSVHGSEIRAAAHAAHAAALANGRNSPAVRQMLAQHGLRESDIAGTGTGGRVTVDDVLGYLAKRARTARSEARASSRLVPHSPTRKRIAERMVESLLHVAPHVTTIFEADMSAVLAHRARHRTEFESRGAPLTLTAYFLAACAEAIREVPEANSRWTDEAVEIHETMDVGIGTAVPGRGLLVPVVRDVQALDLFGIASVLSDLVGRARDNRLTPADVRGGTFTISNHGVSGSLLAAPIVINQPQSAILGIGKLEKRAVVVTENGADRIVVRPRCYVTLTLDHRVMDGDRANRFLEVLVSRLENWPPGGGERGTVRSFDQLPSYI